MNAANAFELHAAELEQTFENLQAQAGGAKSRASSLLAKARTFLDEAKELRSASSLESFSERAAVCRAFAEAQVIFDSVMNPETAPEEGWVECTDTADEKWRVVDTQLMRLYFDKSRGAGLSWFEYKPRKINFCNVAKSRELQPSLRAFLLNDIDDDLAKSICNFDSRAKALTTASTPDVLSIRFSTDSNGVKFDSALDFHAGFGGHLKDANTGFSIECELSGEFPEESVFCLEWNYIMQSGEVGGMTAYALKAVGGVEEGLHELSSPLVLSQEHAQGGLYGVRLIDGVGNLVTDFRFSRPLLKLSIDPVIDELGYQGSRILMYCRASDLADISQRTVLFVSIV